MDMRPKLINLEKYVSKRELELKPKEEKKRPFEVLDGGLKEDLKRDWPQNYRIKKAEANNLFSDLQAKYKKAKWDKQDPLYQNWLTARKQILQIEEILALETNQSNPVESWENDLNERKKRASTEKEAIDLMSEERELPLAKENIRQEQINALTEGFDELEFKLEVKAAMPEITPELQKTALAEETSAEKDVELVRRIQEMAKKLVEAEDRLEKAQAGRKNLFKRWFRGLIHGQKMPEEMNFAKTNQDYQTAKMAYEEAWVAYEDNHLLSSSEKKKFQEMALKFTASKSSGRSAPFGTISESRG